MTVNAVVDERALREIYLYAFEQAVKSAQPYCIMNAYNKLNGQSCAENKRLLTDILRNEWGFEGLVMSDWGATYNVAKSIEAGMDLEMPDGGSYHEKLTVKYVNEGTLSTEALDKACFILAGIDEHSLLQAVTTAVDMNDNADYGIPVPNYVEENVSTKVVKIIQSYTGVVNKMVWRKF